MQGVPFVCAMGHVAKENECLREGKSTWVCTSTWACGYLRFFMSSSAVFKAQAVSWRRVGRCFSWHMGTCGCIAEQERGCLYVQAGILLGEAEGETSGQSCR